MIRDSYNNDRLKLISFKGDENLGFSTAENALRSLAPKNEASFLRTRNRSP